MLLLACSVPNLEACDLTTHFDPELGRVVALSCSARGIEAMIGETLQNICLAHKGVAHDHNFEATLGIIQMLRRRTLYWARGMIPTNDLFQTLRCCDKRAMRI
jgi:hypothetical protein